MPIPLLDTVLATLTASAYSNGDNVGGALGALGGYIEEEGGDKRKGLKRFLDDPYQAANVTIIGALALANASIYVILGDHIATAFAAAVEGTVLNVDSVGAAAYVRVVHLRMKHRLLRAVGDPQVIAGMAA